MTTPMDHDRCSGRLGPFLRGELAPTEAEAVASHLGTCAECTGERNALAAVLAVEVEPLSDDERARLAQAVAAQRRAEVVAFASPRTSWRARVAPALGAAALIAVIAVSAVWFGSDGGGDDDGGAGSVPESATGGDAATPAPDQESFERSEGQKRRSERSSADLSAGALEDEGTSSTKSTTTQGEASKPAPASEPFAAEDKGGGTDQSGGTTSGGGGGTEPGPPEQTDKPAPDSLSMSPTADTAEIGTCNAFTIMVADKDGDPVEGVTLDIEQRHELAQDDTPANEPDVGFCTPSDGSNPSAVDESEGDLGPSQENPDNLGTAGGATGTTNHDGHVTIGIEVAPANGSDGAGDVTLVVFYDTSEDDDPGSDEPQDSATNTWVAPGQDRAPRSRDAPYAARIARAGGIF